MRPTGHLAASTAAGCFLWGVTSEPLALPITVASGVAVDIDHGADLWWNLALRKKPVAMYFLHSWEWLIVILAIGVQQGIPWWFSAMSLGYGLHLITDRLSHGRATWRDYLLLYRAWHRFRVTRPEDEWTVDGAYENLKVEVPLAALLIHWWWTIVAREPQ